MVESEEEPRFSIVENAQHCSYSLLIQTFSRAHRLTSLRVVKLQASERECSCAFTFPTWHGQFTFFWMELCSD